MALEFRQTLYMSVRRAGVTQLAECLLPKSERLSAVASRVGYRPNRLSYTLLRERLPWGRFPALGHLLTPATSVYEGADAGPSGSLAIEIDPGGELDMQRNG